MAPKKISTKKKVAPKKTIDHVVTQLDLDTDPKLVEDGVKLGDTIQLPVAEGKYHVFISVNDKTYEADTDSIREYIMSLGLTYLQTKVIFKVTAGDKTVEKVMMGPMARRLFVNPMTALVFEKNIINALA